MRRAPGMVGVAVSEQDVRNLIGGEPILPQLLRDTIDLQPGSGIYQNGRRATVDEIDVAIILVGEAKAIQTAADQINPRGQPHGHRPLIVKRRHTSACATKEATQVYKDRPCLSVRPLQTMCPGPRLPCMLS